MADIEKSKRIPVKILGVAIGSAVILRDGSFDFIISPSFQGREFRAKVESHAISGIDIRPIFASKNRPPSA